MELEDTQRSDELEASASRSPTDKGDGPAHAETLDGGSIDRPAPSSEEAIEVKLGGLRARQREVDLDAKRRKAGTLAGLFGLPLEAVKIGRFAVVRKLGAGGMGVVYLAYDEKLDRRVAVKLLHGAATTPETKTRFEREAQAMARLSHPNVVTVHEVGTHEEQIYVAMEFVEGSDLRGWMASGSRHWREVVEMLRQAGEGLAAAHEAGIVHRDFKPDNVLVGKDGRARVADFGLAHGFGEPVELLPKPPEDSASSRLNTELTRTGAIMGTPAYMPPEQYAGLRSDARGDQFSFCVALWEALYGERPFKGANLLDLSHAVSEGRISEPSDERHVPTWLRALLVRGLASEPAARWPSMQALLDAIGDDPNARRRRMLARVGVGLGALALVGAAWVASNEIGHNARQRYWNTLTEELLDLERGRGLQQARDDATRARDATRMSVARSYKPKTGKVERADPALAVALLREVEGEARASGEWISMVNELLGQPMSKAVLHGHRGAITALEISRDGRWVYSASDDGEVWRWDMRRYVGEMIVRHEMAVSSLALGPGGRLLSSSEDGTVRSWSAGGGEAEILARYERPVSALAVDPSGRTLASASSSGELQLYDFTTGELQQLDGGGRKVYALGFDPSGEWLLSGGMDMHARLWRVGESVPRRILVGHQKPVFFVRLLSSELVLTAADDGTVLSWALTPDEPPPTTLVHHTAPITAFAVHEHTIATATLDGSMWLTQLDQPEQPLVLPPHADAVWSLAFSSDGSRLASASFDESARLTRCDGRGVPLVLSGHHSALYGAGIDPSNRWLVTGSYDHDLRVWDLERTPLVTSLRGHTDAVFSVEVDGVGARALTASHDGSARVWDMEDGTLLANSTSSTRDRSPSKLNHAVFSPDGAHVGLARADGEVLLWHLATEETRRLGLHRNSVWRIAFAPNGELVASASADGDVGLWPVDGGHPGVRLHGHTNRVWDVDFDASGAHLASASWDGTVRIWEVSTGTQLASLAGHTGRVLRVEHSPDGSSWATASSDGTARLWPSDLRGEPIILSGHELGLWSLGFDASGERLVTVANDGAAIVWNVSEGSMLARFGDHGAQVMDAAFLGGDRLATVARDGVLRVWALDSDQPPLALPAHSESIESIAVDASGLHLVSGANDGSAMLWRTELLTSETEQLLRALTEVSSYCPASEQRQRELGETAAAARTAVAACERARGRD